MKLSLVGRSALALFASLTLGLGMTGCGGGTVGFLWVIGQQYNQIAGFKIDDYTGNLTQTPGEPFTSGGAVPVSLVVKPGGRYLYVLNQGTGAVAPTASTPGTHAVGGNISVFSVGGDGALTFQQSYTTQGFNSKWLQFDSTGNFLYVLDQYAPDYGAVTGSVADVNGSVTAYSVDASSGRLTLLQDTQNVANGNPAPTYFEVGTPGQTTQQFAAPFMMKQAGNCLFVATPHAIVPFSFANGQLQTVTNGGITITGTISSVGGSASFLSVTDSANNTVTLYTIGSACALQATGGGPTSLASYGTTNPVYSLIDNSGQYLYVLNQGPNTNITLPSSTVMAFKILGASNNQLNPLTGAPYGVGSGPVCMVEDPTGQYMYVSNHNDGTISGFTFTTSYGFLAPLTRGSTFNATGQLECLAVSGAVD